MAELDGRWISAVFTTDADFKLGARLASTICRHTNKLADPFPIKDGKGILLENAFGDIRRQNFVYVIAREAKRSLRQVIGAKREELRFLRDFIRNQGCARQFDHSADEIIDLHPLLSKDFLSNTIHDRRLIG